MADDLQATAPDITVSPPRLDPLEDVAAADGDETASELNEEGEAHDEVSSEHFVCGSLSQSDGQPNAKHTLDNAPLDVQGDQPKAARNNTLSSAEDDKGQPHATRATSSSPQIVTKAPSANKHGRSISDEDDDSAGSPKTKRSKVQTQECSASQSSVASIRSNIVVDMSSSLPRSSGVRKKALWELREEVEETQVIDMDDESNTDYEDDVSPHPKPSRSLTRASTTPGDLNTASVHSLSSDAKLSVAISNSSITERKALMKFLTTHCNYQDKVGAQTNVLCVGKVSTTPKILLAVVLGVPVVSDEWLTKSAKAKKILDHKAFHIQDEAFKKRYGRDLASAAGHPYDHVFADQQIFMTAAAKRSYGPGYRDIVSICMAAGAVSVKSGAAQALIKLGDDAIVIGEEDGDEDAITLHDHGYSIRKKDVLSHSILSGKFQSNGEFAFTPGPIMAGKRVSTRKTKARSL